MSATRRIHHRYECGGPSLAECDRPRCIRKTGRNGTALNSRLAAEHSLEREPGQQVESIQPTGITGSDCGGRPSFFAAIAIVTSLGLVLCPIDDTSTFWVREISSNAQGSNLPPPSSIATTDVARSPTASGVVCLTLSRAKQTWVFHGLMSANDPRETWPGRTSRRNTRAETA